ncbi:MAG: DUF86 domain-containing protein [Bacteroidetes bacterium]|nr:DUF86 domain-containing protein [Bacteroidota bacterium]
MDKQIGKWLVDIINCINEIDSYFVDTPKELDTYRQNLMLRRAVERDLEIIGEAVNRIRKKQPDINISSAEKIVQFRNVVIHAYDTIADELIWGVLINHLPVLKKDALAILKINFPNYPAGE